MNGVPLPVTGMTAKIEEKAWEIERKGLLEELTRLREEVQSLQLERDAYLKTVKALIPPEPFTFTEAELKDLEENGVSFDQIRADFKALGIGG